MIDNVPARVGAARPVVHCITIMVAMDFIARGLLAARARAATNALQAVQLMRQQQSRGRCDSGLLEQAVASLAAQYAGVMGGSPMHGFQPLRSGTQA